MLKTNLAIVFYVFLLQHFLTAQLAFLTLFKILKKTYQLIKLYFLRNGTHLLFPSVHAQVRLNLFQVHRAVSIRKKYVNHHISIFYNSPYLSFICDSFCIRNKFFLFYYACLMQCSFCVTYSLKFLC